MRMLVIFQRNRKNGCWLMIKEPLLENNSNDEFVVKIKQRIHP